MRPRLVWPIALEKDKRVNNRDRQICMILYTLVRSSKRHGLHISEGELCSLSGCTASSVDQAIRRLEVFGYIARLYPIGGRKPSYPVYRCPRSAVCEEEVLESVPGEAS